MNSSWGMFVLSEGEEALFATLRAVVTQSGCRSVVRVAGGWVRDKMLGLSPDDMDLVVDNMPARDFAALLARSRPEETRGGKVITSRPEQHKHVEVVTLKLSHGPTIDLSSHMGHSPEEEACRRDFTINSLFYNIHQGDIEDLTKMGIQDLQDGLLRTPLEAKTTLQHDPLRVLRCVRFAFRFGFRIDPDLSSTMKDSEILKQLEQNVSRQRLAAEITKILLGPQPDKALLFICDLGLLKILFPKTKGKELWTSDLTQLACHSIRMAVTHAAVIHRSQASLEQKQEQQKLELGADMCSVPYLLAALFLPLSFSPHCLIDRAKRTFLPFSKWDMREYWRFSENHTAAVFLMISRAHDFERLAARASWGSDLTPENHLQAARLLHELGPEWIHAIRLARVLAGLRRIHELSTSVPHNPEGSRGEREVDCLEAWIRASAFVGSQPVWALSTVVKPRELRDAAQEQTENKLSGQDIGRLVSLALDWQLVRHPVLPTTEAKQECLAWVTTQWLKTVRG